MEKLRNAWDWFRTQDTQTKTMLGVVAMVTLLGALGVIL